MKNNTDGNLAALNKYMREQDAYYCAENAREDAIIEKVDDYLTDHVMVVEAFSEMVPADMDLIVRQMQKAEMSNSDYAFECDAYVGRVVRKNIIAYLEQLAEQELDND